MEYVFGTLKEREILKTVGDSHSDLTGFHTITREYPDQTITDTFYVVEKYDSKEDVEGNCYDWYEIDKHYRVTDKSGPITEKLNTTVESMEDAICEQDAAYDERMSAIEDAICELDAAVNK